MTLELLCFEIDRVVFKLLTITFNLVISPCSNNWYYSNNRYWSQHHKFDYNMEKLLKKRLL